MAALAAGDAYRDPQRLVFKGGTMLRVCGLPDYRYWRISTSIGLGHAAGFRKAVAVAVSVAAGGGTFLSLPPDPLKPVAGGRGGSTTVGWSYQGLTGRIEVDASFVDQIEIPTQNWPIIRPITRTHRRAPSMPRGTTLEAGPSATS